ncbi:pilus assembly FimT family protein [Atopomonas sediminilitoris]|uniref:pilus assembly FimT family protein n=1 Tax=Atopomonas sediminilitoris TaxID=2919919 RepID=UPI001F4DEB3C|nr:GspH/FimT family pseudopilin [Atopomonas sediminilitoris]MCJ8168410.1 prepilin-type N-terminal cleavage/methylation domain-containing protein [Atopomonas sediminilitoris]
MRGFTLVELLLVIVIIGTLSAVVGPRFFSRVQFDDRLFYEETLAAVRYAQKLAVASNCQVRVGLSQGSGYVVERNQSCANSANWVAVVDPSEGQPPYANSAVPSGVTISVSGFPLVFDSQGRAAAAQGTIGGFTFNVTAGTGYVKGQL